MKSIIKKYIFFLFFLTSLNLFSLNLKWLDIIQNLESDSIKINCEYETEQSEYVLAESIKASSFPSRQFVSTVFEKQPDELYIPTQSRPILVLHGKGIINFIINFPEGSIDKIFVSYNTYDFKEKKQSEIKNLTISNKEKKTLSEKTIEESIENFQDEKTLYEEEIKELINEAENENSISFKDENEKTSFIFNLFNSTKNSFFIFIVIFFVGIFMSMTPCMYPMIPITLSILEIDKNNTRKKNIIKSIIYTLGISLTFSILGLLSFSGKLLFGGLFSQKWFLYFITTFFLYMIMTTFEILKFKSFSFSFINKINLKSSIGVFIYGVFSGTIFSPCVSPGLFALLTLASEEKNILLSAFMLFIFGFGMGFPFILLSFFYQELNLMPKAGPWMNFVKYIIGLMLIILWISYLNLLFSEKISYLLALFVLFIVFYKIFKNYKISTNKNEKLWNKIFLLILAFFGILFLKKIIKNLKNQNELNQKIIFFKNLEEAKEIAITEKKFLLIDFTAPWCSSCKKIDDKFFQNNYFLNEISNFLVLSKISFDKENFNYCEKIASNFEIKGLPTIIILNPVNDEIINKFDSSILDLTEKDFLEKIKFFCRGENENL